MHNMQRHETKPFAWVTFDPCCASEGYTVGIQGAEHGPIGFFFFQKLQNYFHPIDLATQYFLTNYIIFRYFFISTSFP